VVHALAQRRTKNARHLFIKFACCSFAQLERVKRIWPTVPWLFLYRDPVETIVSNMTDVPPWLIDNDRRVLSSIIGGDASETGLEELCARTIGSLYSTAYNLANDNSMLLNYNQLSVPLIASVLKFFKIDLSTEELETVARTTKAYSKEASGTRAFVADADTKQKLASNLIREMSECWAEKPYQLLEQKNRYERTNTR